MGQILEKYSIKSLPGGRLPTLAECVHAVEHPELADQDVLRYLDQRPEFKEYILTCLAVGA